MPASAATLADFAVWLAESRRIKVSTIKTYLTHVHAIHTDLALDDSSFSDPLLARLFTGLKRRYGDPAPKPKLPITTDILSRLVIALGPLDDEYALMLRAALCVSVFGMLRCGEFTVRRYEDFDVASCVTRRHVEIFRPNDDSDPTHALITLPASKTDPFRRGAVIPLAAAPGSRICPVTALSEYIDSSDAYDDAPLFHDTETDTGKPLLRDTYLYFLNRLLRAAGIPPENYSGHSARRGGATSAFRAGVPDVIVQRMGRWASMTYRRYQDTGVDDLLAHSRRLHQASEQVAASDTAHLHAPWVA
jgi:integrase